ncbi:uncharacterized protein LOC118188367 [Stegodyphus dumicola]|uniref:uncharacterized protein LOC118188367 n=1 Tax=Stegodyphus dumicola TaxID=202533 RepID=UPI0015A9202E|nr:uncharacterized protein LOC118188367 [Stegodyphus dumicola]
MFLQFLFLIGLAGSALQESSLQCSGEKCCTVSVDDCLIDLQTFLKLTELPFTSEHTELHKLCSQAARGYNCSVNAMASNCVKGKLRDEILPLYLGMAQHTFIMLCGNGYDTCGYLEGAFLQHSGCVMKNKLEIECCARETGVPDLPALRILEQPVESMLENQVSPCCSVSRYMKCATQVVNLNCGQAAANFTTEYLKRASGEQLQTLCHRMLEYPGTESKMCPVSVPLCSGSWTNLILPSYIYVLFLMFNIIYK